MLDIFAALRASAQSEPGSVAMAWPTGSIRRGDLMRAIGAVASRASASGIQPGQVVVVETANQARRLITHLGLLLLGCRVSATSSLEIFEANGVPVDVFLAENPKGQSAARAFPPRTVLPLTAQWFVPDPSRAATVQGRDHSVIYPSSGSTGTPKLIEVDRSALGERLASIAENPEFSGRPRPLIASGYATITTMREALPSLIRGGPVFWPHGLTGHHIVAAMRLFQPSFMAITPATLSDVLNTLTENPVTIRKLEWLRLSSAYCVPELQELALEHLAEKVVTAYGSTELCCITRQVFHVGQPEATVGRLREEIDVVATDHRGNELPAGAEGRLRMRARSARAGRYIGRAASMPDIHTDGWFTPGDTGWVDADRNLFVTGRSTTVINLGGDKVNPETVEGLAARCPGIVDVGVAGVADRYGIVRLHAAVVSKRTVDLSRLNEILAQKGGKYVLRSVQKVTNIPRTENGKIDRPALAKLVQG
jgi:acyl-CoA synthetase (AMP-forming)/AMP-acid ligase II